MPATTTRPAPPAALYLALELGWTEWKLAFAAAPADRPRLRTVPARDRAAVLREVAGAKERFGLPTGAPTRSCYEAGRDGFWVHLWLTAAGVQNVVVDSASIDVNRRARRSKTDRLDTGKLVAMLMRYHGGEARVWSVVRVPAVADEDRRHLHRDLLEMKAERTRHVKASKGCMRNSSVTYSTSVSESVAVQNTFRGGISVADAVTVSDAVSPLQICFVSVSEAVSVAEAVTVQLITFSGTDLNVSVSDSGTVSEAVTARVDLNPAVNDTVAVAEGVTVQLGIDLAVSDSATVAETALRLLTSGASTAESVNVSNPILPLSAAETVTVAVADTFMRAPVGTKGIEALLSEPKSVRLTDMPKGEVDPRGT